MEIQIRRPIGINRILYFVALITPFALNVASAEVNSWTNSTSGNWDDAFAWSLGVLPESSQSVMITNSGWKAVAINPSTPANFPESMAVSNLTIRGAWDTENTLLLNSLGTSVPLSISNGLTLQDGAHLVNFNSGLIVQNGVVIVTNAQIVQDGGFIRTTNALMNLFNSEYYLTNGGFEGGTVSIGLQEASHINQYGGTATIENLIFPFIAAAGTGSRGYSLYGGTLNLPNGLNLEGQGGSPTAYLQEGGTNHTTEIRLESGLTGPTPEFTLNGGLLEDTDVQVLADTIEIDVQQNGGTHSISNDLRIAGGARTGQGRTARYQLNGGMLSARRIELESHQGPAAFIQSDGIAQAEEIQANGYWVFQSDLTLTGGTLNCSNLYVNDGAILHQHGGILIASNSLSFGGYREPGPKIYTRYEFLGGMLIASNIDVGGDWIIGNSSVENRISNSGFTRLSHTLQISNAVEQLGRFILATNATIDLAGSASRLSFANSSGEMWESAATLEVLNWNGNVSAGGTEQLKFGTDQSGLTSTQLSQIRFRIGTNVYGAKIVDTGEVVPDQFIPPLAFSKHGNDLVLTWPSGWTLQTATNVPGPYSDVSGATSPYTNAIPPDGQRFFRLRQ